MPDLQHKRPCLLKLLEREAERRTKAARGNTTLEQKRRHKEVAKTIEDIMARARQEIEDL